jgi:hypothetical protein
MSEKKVIKPYDGMRVAFWSLGQSEGYRTIYRENGTWVARTDAGDICLTGSAVEDFLATGEYEPVEYKQPESAQPESGLPTDAKARKAVPIYSGVIKYFPDALCAVAELSRIGNEQHNPGQPLGWDRSKSGDELDALVRHLMDAGTIDTDGVRHSTKVAWRALANLQKEIEASRAS